MIHVVLEPLGTTIVAASGFKHADGLENIFQTLPAD